MPWLNWPNGITIGRIALVAPLVICLLNLDEGDLVRHIALGLLAVMGLSDAVDGFLARRLGQQTVLGRFLDPIADKLLITCAVIILAVDSLAVPGFRLPNWVPVLAIGKDITVVLGFSLIYLTTGLHYLRPRPLGKVCTLAQLVMLTVVLLAPDLPALLQRFVPALWWLATIIAVLTAVDYVRVGIRFASDHYEQQQETRAP